MTIQPSGLHQGANERRRLPVPVDRAGQEFVGVFPDRAVGSELGAEVPQTFQNADGFEAAAGAVVSAAFGPFTPASSFNELPSNMPAGPPGFTLTNDILAPAGVGAKGSVEVSKLLLWNDTFFTPADGGPADSVDTFHVQPGHYLCLGDNSGQSSDSRKWGLVPDMAGTPILATLVRDDILRELTYTGRIFSAQEAMSYGLATRICDDPRAAALELAREIAGKSPDAIRAAKRMLNKLSVDPGPALLAESVEQQKLLGSANQTEAVRANMEKRAPRFAEA